MEYISQVVYGLYYPRGVVEYDNVSGADGDHEREELGSDYNGFEE